MPLELRFLPANKGDAIWVRWGESLEHQMIVDMGTAMTGRALRQRLERLSIPERRVDLLVVTHVDADHIGGVLSALADSGDLEGLLFDDIWFNGWAHLHGRSVPVLGAPAELEAMGPVQGESFTTWLRGPWNEAFGRGPVQRADPLRTVELAGGLSLTILGPTADRLRRLRAKWEEAVRLATERGALNDVSAGLEVLGGKRPEKPRLESIADLHALADSSSRSDPSASNGTSITLLARWRERSVLLTGDAYATDIVDGRGLLAGASALPMDVVKLPHHGSEGNVSRALVAAVRCGAWVFSTDGSGHFHPDAAAVARVVRHATARPPRLLFNVPNEFSAWWDNDEWKTAFGYTTETGTAEQGLTITLDAG